ncbi:MAG: nucleoside triphosphate pyrophosphohydrolase [Candidatus Wallbacteria bacterium]
MPVYNKIVRDKIPDIIRNEKRNCNIKILSDKDAVNLLSQKILEEADEFLKEPSKEEMADIFEILHSIIKKYNWTYDEIEKIRINKANKNGSFDKNIFLIDTD